MDNAWKKYVDMATGLTELTRQNAERVVRGLVKQGEIAADQVERSVDDLLKRSEKNRRAVTALVRSEVERTIGRLGLAARESRPGTPTPTPPSSAPTAATTTRTAAKKTSAARRAAKASAAPAAGVGASQASAGKATAKKSAGVAAKTATAKKSSAKK